MTNCPNCCAPLNYIGGLHCDYCGTWFERPDESDYVVFYSDDKPFFYMNSRTGESISAEDWPHPPNLATR